MNKIFISLVVAVGYFLAADNAAAAIAVIATPASSDQSRYLIFDGITLGVIASNTPVNTYKFVFSKVGDFSLGKTSSDNNGNGGFTAAPITDGSLINSATGYGNSLFYSGSLNNTYIGFQYDRGTANAPSSHYGWMNFTYSGGLLTLNSAAINTIAGESILAGQTAVTAVPEPGMWVPSLVLVLGVAFRRRRSRSKASVV
jgi:hypothetical protein